MKVEVCYDLVHLRFHTKNPIPEVIKVLQKNFLIKVRLLYLVPGAYEQPEGASNYHTLFAPSSVESRALNLAENAPYKVSSKFAPTSLRSQQVAIITAGGLLGTHTSHSSNLKAH